MISKTARENFINAINYAVRYIADEYEISKLTDLKVHINISDSHNPKISTMVILSKTEKFHIENKKVIKENS